VRGCRWPRLLDAVTHAGIRVERAGVEIVVVRYAMVRLSTLFTSTPGADCDDSKHPVGVVRETRLVCKPDYQRPQRITVEVIPF